MPAQTRSMTRALEKAYSKYGQRFLYGTGAAIADQVRQRFTQSNTKTKTKKKKKLSGQMLSSTLSHSSCYITRSSVRPKNVESQSCFFSESSSGLMQSPAGGGLGNIICVEGSTSQAMISSPVGTNLYANPQLSVVSYRDMLSDVPIQGSGFYLAQTDPPQQKTFMKSLGMEVHISNFATADAVVHLYVLESKKDSNVTPEEFINKCLINASGGKAAASTPAAGTNVGGTAGSYIDDYIVGDPTRVQGFKTEYNVLKKMRFDLTGGHTHEQEFMIKMNLLRDQSAIIAKNVAMTDNSSTWTAANISMAYPKGTIFVFSHVRGGLILDVTGITGVPTYATTKVGFLWKKNKNMSWVSDKGKKSVPQSFYAQYPYNALGINQKFVNIDEIPKNQENV